MKFIKIVLLSTQNLKVFIKQKKALFLTILLGLSISIAAILFYTGYFLKHFEDATGSSDVTLKIKITNSTISTLDIVDMLENNKKIPPVRIMAFENNPDEFLPKTNDQNMKIHIMGDKYLKVLPENLIIYGNYFDNENMDELPITSSALKQLGMKKSVGQSLELNKTNYEIQGLVSPFYYLPYDDNCIVISLKNFLSNYKANYLHFEYDKTITALQSAELSDTLSKFQGIEIIHIPSKSNPLNSSRFLVELFQIILIFFLSFINIFSLSYFWIKSNKRNYSIYSLCGAAKRTITTTIMINNLVITLCGILIGTILFKIISPFLLSFGIITEFTFERYYSILLIIILLSFVLAIVMSIRYNRDQQIYRISGE